MDRQGLKHLIAKYRKHIILAVGLMFLTTCAIVGIKRFYSYLIGEPSLAEARKTLWLIRQGKLNPDHAGCVMTQYQTAYVTRTEQRKLIVLWPYNLAHDDNYFEGYLFEELPLNTDKTTAYGPFRGGHLSTSPPVLTHLTVDSKISEHWYHVQGEMYK